MKYCDEFSILVYYDFPQLWLERWGGTAYLCYWTNTQYTAYIALRLAYSVVSGPVILASDFRREGHFLVENDTWNPIKEVPEEFTLMFRTIEKSKEDQELLSKLEIPNRPHLFFDQYGTATTVDLERHIPTTQTFRW